MTVQADLVARQESAVAPTELPQDLDTAQAKLCYLALASQGAATLDELADALALGKLTLLDVLGTMTEHGHVERTDGGRYAVVR